ncbi:hypothetical protein BDR04DRAFT_1122560 [Suillus decipiens]|nr:hypothetical protein BDR04DRAFT_1122560 [Suillus decipiens]
MLERIHDAVIEHLQTKHTHNKELLDLLEVVKKWTPPTELLNWDKCMEELWAAMKQTGFNQYRPWHCSFLKCAADENEDLFTSQREPRLTAGAAEALHRRKRAGGHELNAEALK